MLLLRVLGGSLMRVNVTGGAGVLVSRDDIAPKRRYVTSEIRWKLEPRYLSKQPRR